MSDMLDLDDIINKYSTKKPQNDKVSDSDDNKKNSVLDPAEERKRRIAEALARSVDRIVEAEELENKERSAEKKAKEPTTEKKAEAKPEKAADKKTNETVSEKKPEKAAEEKPETKPVKAEKPADESKKPLKDLSVTEIISADLKDQEAVDDEKASDNDTDEKSENKTAAADDGLNDRPVLKKLAGAKAKNAEDKPKKRAPSAPLIKRNTVRVSAPKPEPKPKERELSIEERLKLQDEAERRKKSKEKAVAVINKEPFFARIGKYRFLFEELTKRDFKKKYKRAALGVLWSVISPFLMFLTQYLVFSYLFNRNVNNFPIYLLTGNLMFSFFSNATTSGMFSMYSNGGIISKVKAPKILFLLSSNVASIFNFALTMVVYFGFLIFNDITFGPHMLLMLYPIICITVFNIGVSLVLASLFVFFRDTQYLYSIFTTMLLYFSAVFYSVKSLPENMQIFFQFNPVYKYIEYVRCIVIDVQIPDLKTHLMCLGYAAGMLLIGYIVHKKTEDKFIYYF